MAERLVQPDATAARGSSDAEGVRRPAGLRAHLIALALALAVLLPTLAVGGGAA